MADLDVSDVPYSVAQVGKPSPPETNSELEKFLTRALELHPDLLTGMMASREAICQALEATERKFVQKMSVMDFGRTHLIPLTRENIREIIEAVLAKDKDAQRNPASPVAATYVKEKARILLREEGNSIQPYLEIDENAELAWRAYNPNGEELRATAKRNNRTGRKTTMLEKLGSFLSRLTGKK